MKRSSLAIAILLAACKSSQPSAPAPATAAATAPPDCGTLSGDNAVRTEMVRLECALQRSIAAIGRDELTTIPPMIEMVDSAKAQTEKALESGAYKLQQGDLASFKAMDEAFHHSLIGFVEAAGKNDHPATAAALGTLLGQCQGCHATFRPVRPQPQGAPAAAGSARAHAH